MNNYAVVIGVDELCSQSVVESLFLFLVLASSNDQLHGTKHSLFVIHRHGNLVSDTTLCDRHHLQYGPAVLNSSLEYGHRVGLDRLLVKVSRLFLFLVRLEFLVKLAELCQLDLVESLVKQGNTVSKRSF